MADPSPNSSQAGPGESTSDPVPEIVRADPDLGRTLAVLAGASTLAVVAVGELVRSYFSGLEELSASDPAAAVDQAATAVRVGMAAVGISMAAASLLLARAALGIARSGRFPAPGSRVLRDTKVVVGAAARYRAIALGLAAAAMLFCALYAGLTGERLAEGLLATAKQH